MFRASPVTHSQTQHRFTSPQASTGERDEQRGVTGNHPLLDPDPRPSTSRVKGEQPPSEPINGAIIISTINYLPITVTFKIFFVSYVSITTPTCTQTVACA